ncbi:hypothetical protein GSI_14686 [Ganoderma sinense ZZ0214-1]|uniref:Uncharacterized protein n=1 Tax=Ganoderma sinense ZZ0214-1 TaxID=1077348 RepID=A0A2G8RPC8_9APHY|nr:hypothetical protein GSI_14686 [Ganoderma sinense ZZ0214-1]
MNTPQTMASQSSRLYVVGARNECLALTQQMLGWGSLVVAAGVSFYFAKKTIIERRQMQEAAGQRPSEKLDWRARIDRQEKNAMSAQSTSTSTSIGTSSAVDVGSAGKGPS